jgi:hypothetical protein
MDAKLKLILIFFEIMINKSLWQNSQERLK